MKKLNLAVLASIAIGILSTGCVDNNYDLSDLDNTVRFDAKDLVIPINIDQIKLKSIIKIKDDGKIKIIDGAYTYVQDGSFNTGNISVPSLTVKSSRVSTVDLELNTGINISYGSAPMDINISLPVPNKTTSYDFSSQKISDDICDLYKVEGDCSLKIDIAIEGINSEAVKYEFSNFKLQIPEGIHIANSDGCVVKDNYLIINQSYNKPKFSLGLTADALNIPAGAFNGTTHDLHVSGLVGIIDGDIKISVAKGASVSIPEKLQLVVNFSFGDMDIHTVDGVIKYAIDDVNIPEINITDLPDVLAQSGTNLLLANPCLYLGVNNPLAECGVYAQTGLTISAYHGSTFQSYSIDEPYFTIAAKELQNLCFSPYSPSSVDKEYADSKHVAFAKLGAILSGDGIPDKLKVELVDPNVPAQEIKGFMLGHSYGDVHGSYKFVAPLQFAEGTSIVYSDKTDGWSSDDLDKMDISNLEVNMLVTTDVPVSLDFTGYPIDKNGVRIAGVTIEGANIEANAKSQAVKVIAKGNIKNLDGIEFEAKAKVGSGGDALSPDMTITLNNIRPKVTGFYQTEL